MKTQKTQKWNNVRSPECDRLHRMSKIRSLGRELLAKQQEINELCQHLTDFIREAGIAEHQDMLSKTMATMTPVRRILYLGELRDLIGASPAFDEAERL